MSKKYAINMLRFSIFNITEHYNQNILQRLKFMWLYRGNRVPYWSDSVLVRVAIRDMEEVLKHLTN